MKKIFLVIVIFLSFIGISEVNALEDSFYEGEYIPGEYIIKKNLKNSTIRYQQMHVFRRVSDNQPVYCLQVSEVLNNYKKLQGYDYSQVSYENVDDFRLDLAIVTAYYGYGYGNHTDIKWYAITQFLIWQLTSAYTTTYFTDSLNGNIIDKYKDEIKEINDLISTYFKAPSFNKTNTPVRHREIEIIPDSYELLGNYEILDSDNTFTYIDGNNLVAKVDSVGLHRVTLVNKPKYYDNDPIIYVDPNGQDLLAVGRYKPAYAYIDLFLDGYDLTIKKIDSLTGINLPQGDASLENCVFQLLDLEKNVVSTFKTNKDGIINIKNLAIGDYYLREIESCLGYNLNDKEIYFYHGRDSYIEYANEVIKNKITINKYLKNADGEIIPEGHVKFNILSSNNELYNEFETDDNGYYELFLPYGEYIIKQINGKDNYKFTDDFNITISKDGVIQHFDLYDEQLVVNFKIKNIDSDSLLPIFSNDSTYEVSKIDSNDVFRLKANFDGLTDSILLTSGIYEIKQLGSVYGYKINNDIFKLVVNESLYSFDNNGVVKNISNKKEKAIIEIEKIIEKYYDDVLVDTVFVDDYSSKIYSKDDNFSKDNVLLYEKDSVVCSINTNNSCLLEYGDYYIIDDISNQIIDIKIDNFDNKKGTILEKLYDYSNDEFDVIEVPDTYKEEIDYNYIYLLFVYVGMIIIIRSKKNED